jgi:hypothetical protein
VICCPNTLCSLLYCGFQLVTLAVGQRLLQFNARRCSDGSSMLPVQVLLPKGDYDEAVRLLVWLSLSYANLAVLLAPAPGTWHRD